MTEATNERRFISLRIKVLVVFTLIFAVAFAVAFYWFYTFATAQAMSRIQADLHDTIYGAALGTDVDSLIALYEEGEPNAEGFSDDPRYEAQIAWFEQVHAIEPRAWPYNYIKGDEEIPVVYIADLWANTENPEKAVQFLEPKFSQGTSYSAFLVDDYVEVGEPVYNLGYPGEEMLEGWCEDGFGNVFTGWCDDIAGNFPLYRAGLVQKRFSTYSDEWGRWVSAYAPLEDSSGQVVGAVGIDFEADYVDEVQQGIRDRVVVAFGITYAVLFALVYVVSGSLTQPILQLTEIAEKIGEGDYSQDFSDISETGPRDEIDTLTSVFRFMVDKVRAREESLKQQVAELQIIVDQSKRDAQVSEIVESDFFQELQIKADKLRLRREDRDDEA